MLNPKILDETFNQIIKEINTTLPDGIIDVNLDLIQSLGLLNLESLEHEVSLFKNSQQFYMVENEDKLTLFNEQFTIWMIPSFTDKNGVTYVFIAKNEKDKVQKLELLFQAKGIYNTSWTVLSILDAFLQEIHENDQMMQQL